MRFVYSVKDEKFTVSDSIFEGKFREDVISRLPQKSSEYPIYALIPDRDRKILYKVYSDTNYDTLTSFFAVLENMEGVFELFEERDVDCPIRKDGTLLLSRAALRATLKMLYLKKRVTVFLEDGQALDIKNGESVLRQIYRYLDFDTALYIASFVNFAPQSKEEKGIFILPKSRMDSKSDYIEYDLAYSVNNNTAADQFVDYLIDSDIESRRKLLSLIAKYKDYCVKEAEFSPEIQIYKAFVEGDENLLFDMVHSYCVETAKRGDIPVVEEGVGLLLRQNIGDRAILKLIYDGYESHCFGELIKKNIGEIAFCASFREVGELFKGDNAESYNIMLASLITQKADADSEQNRYKLIEEELIKTETLALTARYAPEIAMINSYRKVLFTLQKRAEDVTNTKSEALDEISALVMTSNKEQLFSDELSVKINEICQKHGVDADYVTQEVETLKSDRYRRLLCDEIEKKLDSQADPKLTLELADTLTPAKSSGADVDAIHNEDKANESNIENTETSDDKTDSTLDKKLRSICDMTKENYLNVYYDLFGSDYFNELIGIEDEEKEKGALKEVYKNKLCELFLSYDDYKKELLACDRLKENPPLKMLAEMRYSDTLCIALEDSDIDGISSVISRFDPDRTDARVFYPLLYKKVVSMAREKMSSDFIDGLRKKNLDRTLDSILLAAKVKASVQNGSRDLKNEVNELAVVFDLVKKYIGNDIVFDITIDGKTYIGISLEAYMWALGGENTERVISLAERNGDFNDFLAKMNVAGFKVKNVILPLDGNKTADQKQEGQKENMSQAYKIVFVDNAIEPQSKKSTEKKTEREVRQGSNINPQPKKEPEINEAAKISNETDPEKYNFSKKLHKAPSNKESPDLMKMGITVLSILTVIVIILFIFFLGR